jgi:hypothetical protein
MARSAANTASILSCFYDKTFANESCEAFRISWSDLRGIAGVARITSGYLRRINLELNELGYTMNTFDNYLAIVQETDLAHIRMVPPRIVEKYLYDKDMEEDYELVDDDDAGNPEVWEIDRTVDSA